MWKIPGAGKQGPANRRRLAWTGILLATGPFLAAGQLVLDLRLPSSNVVLFEPVVGVVTFRNNTGRPIVFGEQPEFAELRFGIELGQGTLVKPLSEAPLATTLALAPGETRSMDYTITRLYAMNAMGRYRIQAQVDMGGVTYVSAPVRLDVVKGSELCRVQAGVPDDPRASRTYVLEYIQKNTAEENIYLRIEDEQAGEIYGMFNLGRVVRVRAPDLQVDEAGNVHVLFQTPGMSYLHAVFTPYGTRLATDTYPGGARHVDMTRLPNGRVTVSSSKLNGPSEAGVAGALPPDKEEGPITEIKKKVGGLFGKFSE